MVIKTVGGRLQVYVYLPDEQEQVGGSRTATFFPHCKYT